MSTSKLIDNNRRTHAAKVLAQASKKNQTSEENVNVHEHEHEHEHEEEQSSSIKSLNEQYSVIREDVLKLREDLAHGYDLLKDYLESKMNLRTLIRVK